jgi:ribonuclease III
MARPPDPGPRPPEELISALEIACSAPLMVRALTHRSYAYEHGGLPTNERLEFLGDSVLGLVVTDSLYRRHPDLPEGQLAKLRASIVNMRALAAVARTVGAAGSGGLGAYIHLGRGEQTTGGDDKPSILADTLEAVIGATYEDSGMAAAAELVLRLFEPLLAGTSQGHGGLDWKTALQESSASRGSGPPEYTVVESGPDHAKQFVAVIQLGGEQLGEGVGSSKKEAEQQAAAQALEKLEGGTEQAPSEVGMLSSGDGEAPAGISGTSTTNGP